MYNTENKQEIDLGRLQDELETQYGPAVAQDIVDRIRKADTPAIKAKAPSVPMKAMTHWSMKSSSFSRQARRQ